jgi:hypothetical protein
VLHITTQCPTPPLHMQWERPGRPRTAIGGPTTFGARQIVGAKCQSVAPPHRLRFLYYRHTYRRGNIRCGPFRYRPDPARRRLQRSPVAGNEMTTTDTGGPGDFWREIVARETLGYFATAFADDVVFETSSCNRTVRGPAELRTLIRAMSSLYSSLEFVAQNDALDRTYLEWTGSALGEDVAGVTVIERDASGKITSVRLHQRPLGAVVRFANELGRRQIPEFSADDFAIKEHRQ